MIVHKINKTFQTRSDKPNSNWLNDDNYIVIPDGSELANKINKFFPRFDFVLDEQGEIIDVIEVEKTEEELKQERIEEIDIELKAIDSEGVTRHLENSIEASGTYDIIYKTTRELIDKKNQLREERKMLVGGNANAENNVNE